MTQEDRQCCFCGERVHATLQEPVEIAVAFNDGSSQVLWAHIDCMGARLHTSVPWLSREDRDETRE